jgi:hypothetical protein
MLIGVPRRVGRVTFRRVARAPQGRRPSFKFGASAERKGNTMEIVGIFASAVVAVSVLLAAAVAIKSIPDIRHYRRIRSM